MFFIVVLGLIAAFALFLYSINLYSQWEDWKKRKAACLLLPQANAEFNALCNPDRTFTPQEAQAYKKKYIDVSVVIITYGIDKFNTLYSRKYLHNEPTDIATVFEYHYKNIEQLRDFNNNYVHRIRLINEKAESLYDLLRSKMPSNPTINDYFTSSECEAIINSNKELIGAIKYVYPKHKGHITFSHIEDLFLTLVYLEKKRLEYNHSVYIPKYLEDNSLFFDTVLPYPLDPQQRTAIVTDEDNVLVISSAGSGKTSTIIGKARYLLDKHKVDPKKILILTYTRKAASELVERLGNEDVDCSTFHSLAVRILAKLENKKPSIAEPSLLLNVFRKLLESDSKFKEAVLKYILHLQSLMKLEHEYDTAPDYFSDRKKYGIQAPYPDMYGNIIFTKSEEEKRICTLLTELGVPFLYEEPYGFNTYTEEFRQYKPDFTIIINDPHVDPETGVISYRERRVYLEHFAIDANGNVPKWFADKEVGSTWEAQNRKYNDGIRWKRAKHSEKGTMLIETKSADFHRGNIRDVLIHQLNSANVPISPVSPEELYRRLVSRSKKIESSVFKLLEQFIALLKSNSGSIQPFLDKARQDDDKRTLFILRDVINPLLIAYSNELKRRGEIDFTDAIIEATNYCAAGQWQRYDYILVDEFQDISVDRYNFLQFIRAKNPLTKLFCVGDDWQSIYRFAGSNMKLFYKFEEYFGFTEHCKIEKTYRFFDPLLELSSDFIQRNPEQKVKDVQSNAKPMPPTAPDFPPEPAEFVEVEGKRLWFLSSDVPAVKEWLANYRTSFQFHDCGSSNIKESMLPTVTSLIKAIPSNESVLLLGRYNYDVRSLSYDTDKHDFDRNRERIELFIAGRKVRFMSVHAAKGLEADNVILINCNEGIYGFPSLVEDDPILSYVLSEDDQFEYAEERRLFYVALTRAKKHLHILYNGDKPSPFVRELTDVLRADESLCPICQQGRVVVIKHGMASNGNPYTNYGCSNANSGCEYFERVFDDDVPSFVPFNEKFKEEQKQKREQERQHKHQPEPELTPEVKSRLDALASCEAFDNFVKTLHPSTRINTNPYRF